MILNPFNYVDYKKYMRSVLNAKDSSRGLLSRLSEAAECQPSFLSQVIRGNVHMTPDQASGIARFLNLSEGEAEYFLATVDWARAGSPHLKKRLQKRMEHLKAENEDLTRKIDKTPFSVDETNSFFFSSWLWSALQVSVSVPSLQNLPALAERFGMTEKFLLSALEELEKHGFVKKMGSRWIYSGKPVHLPKGSPHVLFHHQNWLARAVLNAQTRTEDSVHFTGVFAISRQDAEALKQMTLKFVQEANAVVAPSPEEEIVCLTCNFFKV